MEKSDQKKATTDQWFQYFQIVIDDIKFAKMQQWRLVYYILLLQVAIVGVYAMPGKFYMEITILFTLSAFLAIFGTYFLIKFQNDLTCYRNRKGKCIDNFPYDLRDIVRDEKAEGDPGYYISFLRLQISIIWISVALVGWIIGFWKLIF